MTSTPLRFDFELIAHASISLLDSLCKLILSTGLTYATKYSQKDLRSDFFINQSMVVIKAVIDIKNFEITRKKLNEYMTLVPSGEANILFQFDTINRRCFITETMFNVEFFLYTILSSLNSTTSKKTPTNYNEIIKDINTLILNDKNKEHVLYAPYLMRNSLHNNGHIVKLGEEFDLPIENKEFHFKKGLLNYAGWGDIVLFIKEMVPVLIEIIESSKVADIKLIPSPFEDEEKTGLKSLDSNVLSNSNREST